MRDKKEKLVAERLILKSLFDSDRDEMVSILKDPLVFKTYMIPDLETKEQEDKLFNKLKRITLSKDYFAYGIYLESRLIGYLNNVQKDDDSIEIGYFISSKEWNKGYASEALAVAITELFDMGYRHVVAGHFACNPASGRVMQKCGMSLLNKTETITYRGVNHQVIYYQIDSD